MDTKLNSSCFGFIGKVEMKSSSAKTFPLGDKTINWYVHGRFFRAIHKQTWNRFSGSETW